MQRFFDILKRWLLGKQVVVLGVFRSEDDYPIHALWVRRFKNEIKHEGYKCFESLQHFADEPEVLKARVPLVLCIDDENVILERQQDSADIFDEENFSTEASEELDAVAVVRNSWLETCLDNLDKLRSQIVEVYVGPGQAVSWLDQVGLEGVVNLGEHAVTSSDGSYEIAPVSESTDTVIEGEKLSPGQLQLYLSSFSFFLNASLTSFPMISATKREFLFEKGLQNLLRVLGFFLLLLFLTSTALFFYFSGENESLEASSYEKKLLYSKAENYKKGIVRLESILDTENRQPVFSRISTDLAKTVPKSISLKELAIFPADMAEMKRSKRLSQQSYVQLTGVSHTMDEVAGWVSTVKELEWVEDISEHEIRQSDAGYVIKMTLRNTYVD